MTTLKVELLAFDSQERIREVTLPQTFEEYENEDHILEATYHFGQNDFQPRQMPSVSAGDVIYFKNKKYLVKNVGFKELTEEEYQKYKKLPRRDRSYQELVRD